MSHSTRVVVRRGSQVHQTFQTGLAQIDARYQGQCYKYYADFTGGQS